MTLKTEMPPISIIVAVDGTGGFGKEGKIPWNFPDDMKHFRTVTTGGICIMGRNTYEDMVAMNAKRKKKAAIATYEEIEAMGSPPTIKPILPGRTSFVVTSNPNYDAPGATAVTGIRDAIQRLEETDNREIFVIGGYRLYIEALSWSKIIYMTIVKDKLYNCDRHFPINALDQYKIVNGTQTDELYFLTYMRG